MRDYAIKYMWLISVKILLCRSSSVVVPAACRSTLDAHQYAGFVYFTIITIIIIKIEFKVILALPLQNRRGNIMKS